MQKGQVLLVVLLSIGVILTVVLSIYSKTISDLSISTQETEASRAFSAAEAGIENALVTGAVTNPYSGVGAPNITGSVSLTFGSEKQYVYPTNLVNGEEATIWFVGHNATDKSIDCTSNPCFYYSSGSTPSFKLCWGQVKSYSAPMIPAVEVSVFYTTTAGNLSNSTVAKAAYDPNASRAGTNFFTNTGVTANGSCSINGTRFQYSVTPLLTDVNSFNILSSSLNAANKLQFMALRMLYNTDISQPVGIDFNGSGTTRNLPSQGRSLSSTATVGSATRKIEVYQIYNAFPSVFDAAVFSPGSLTHE